MESDLSAFICYATSSGKTIKKLKDYPYNSVS